MINTKLLQEAAATDLKNFFKTSADVTITDTELKTKNHRFISVQAHVIQTALVGLYCRANILIRGATGSGKTVFAAALGELHPRGTITLNFNAEVNVEDIKGKYTVKPKTDGSFSLEWLNSLIVEAMQKGYALILEELNFMPVEMSGTFYPITDHRRQLILNEHVGETINAHPDFCIIATCNYGYAGTQNFNPANKSRFDIIIDVDYMKPKQETAMLIKTTGIKEDEAKTIVDTANKLRKNPDQDIDDIGTRTLIAWSALVKSGLSLKEAAEFSIIPFAAATERDKTIIREQIEFFVDKLEAEREEKQKKKAEAAAKKAAAPAAKSEVKK